MKKRAGYERALQAVLEVIHRWYPYCLLAGGCPADEFEREIAAVVAQFPRIRSSSDAVQVLSQVFSSASEPERFRPEDCEATGAQLFEALSALGLLVGKWPNSQGASEARGSDRLPRRFSIPVDH
jgi:hypothetical protein